MKIDMEDIEQKWLGFACQQCGANFVFLEGALSHQVKIWDNHGQCPDAEISEEETDEEC